MKERLEGLRERFDICESRIENDRETKDNTIESVSSILVLEDSYFSSVLNCNNYPFFFIDKRSLVPEEYTIMPFKLECNILPKITIEDKQKLLTKIMVPRGFLN